MKETIYLAGGCFWGVEHFFAQFPDLACSVGYINGSSTRTSYEQVCAGSGHAEAVKIEYNPDTITLAQILAGYFEIIDPTSINRQGNDMGVQYRTGIYYTSAKQLPVIACMLDWLQKQYREKLAIEVQPVEHFVPAEAYHQRYLDKHPNGYCHINPAYFHVRLPDMQRLYALIPGLQTAMEKSV